MEGTLPRCSSLPPSLPPSLRLPQKSPRATRGMSEFPRRHRAPRGPRSESAAISAHGRSVRQQKSFRSRLWPCGVPPSLSFLRSRLSLLSISRAPSHPFAPSLSLSLSLSLSVIALLLPRLLSQLLLSPPSLPGSPRADPSA